MTSLVCLARREGALFNTLSSTPQGYLFTYFNSHPRICLLILERERERARGREREKHGCEKHQLAASCMYVLRPAVKPATFRETERRSNQPNHSARATTLIFRNPHVVFNNQYFYLLLTFKTNNYQFKRRKSLFRRYSKSVCALQFTHIKQKYCTSQSALRLTVLNF